MLGVCWPYHVHVHQSSRRVSQARGGMCYSLPRAWAAACATACPGRGLQPVLQPTRTAGEGCDPRRCRGGGLLLMAGHLSRPCQGLYYVIGMRWQSRRPRPRHAQARPGCSVALRVKGRRPQLVRGGGVGWGARVTGCCGSSSWGHGHARVAHEKPGGPRLDWRACVACMRVWHGCMPSYAHIFYFTNGSGSRSGR